MSTNNGFRPMLSASKKRARSCRFPARTGRRWLTPGSGLELGLGAHPVGLGRRPGPVLVADHEVVVDARVVVQDSQRP